MIRGAGGALLLAAALACAGCDATIHIRLSQSDVQACAVAVPYIRSFYAELERQEAGQGLTFKKCSNIPGTPMLSIPELESFLAGSIIFAEVPTGGSWTIWVQGFPSEGCEKKQGTPLLCGTEQQVAIPPPDDEVPIDVSCVPPQGVWSAEALESCRFP